MTLNKAALFTDIHWGRKSNSEIHNQDCMRFMEFFADTVSSDKEIDHVVFCGDWFEHRSSIDGLTMDYSIKGISILDSLDIPTYFIVGNHDLYYRNNRSVFTTKVFGSVKNLKFIHKNAEVFPELGPHGALIAPFLFEPEYPDLIKYVQYPVWYGHFEFKGFVLTGEHTIKEHGPDHQSFKGVKRIMTGHYHQRQEKDNVNYIGNVFPADFSDAGDTERGMATYTYEDDKLEFTNWDEGPSYANVTLSGVLSGDEKIPEGSYVRCNVDVPLSHSEGVELKKKLLEKLSLRSLSLEEPSHTEGVEDSEIDLSGMEMQSTSELVSELLSRIDTRDIDNDYLQKRYREL